MKNLVNRYVFCQWKHNEGYQQNWLRRITRQTKTQYIADCQHTLLLSDKYKKLYDSKKSDYLYGIFQVCATRMRMIGDKLVGQTTHLSNPDGVNTIELVEDFSSLKCKYKYEELFDVDLRNILFIDSKMIKHMNWSYNHFKEIQSDVKDEIFYKFKTTEISENDDCYGEIAKHLKQLFSLPVHHAHETFNNIDTIHEKSRFSESAIHYHMNFFGDDKPVITSKENYHNSTISFWLFDDKVVFKHEDGIDSW